MTQPQSEPLTPYAPLPVRARGTLEIFDTAFKLFRRYAGVLLAWSAISSLVNLIPILGSMVYIFTMPLMFGAVSCVVAGAVRGQNVGFKQVWGFTKPRYGALLGVLILALILMSVVAFVLMFAVSLIVIMFASLVSPLGWFVTAVAWIIGVIGGLIGASFLLAVVMGWFNLAPVIACLEDANRGSSALSRAWSLLSGNWRKACGVATILALAGTAAFMIIFGFIMFFFYGGWDKFFGADTSFLSGLAASGFATLFFVAWTPLQAVVGAVFYLDLRTRKEALDLEWTNYAAKPELTPAAAQNAPPPTYSAATPPQMGTPPYAPSSLQAQPAPPNANPNQTPLFAAQSPAQPMPTGEAMPVAATAPVPVEVPPVADSFAAFASQMETAPPPQPQPVATPSVAPLEETAPTPIEVQAVTLPATVEAVPPPVVQPEPISLEPPVVPIESVSAPQNTGPTFGVPVSSAAPRPLEPPPVPVAPEPAVTPPTPPVPQPEDTSTSSFAPPRRFRRAASEDDDYPSSFGGGGR